MTTTKKLIAHAAVAAAIACGGAAFSAHADAAGLPPVVTIHEWQHTTIDVAPPQRLDVIMIWTGRRSTTRRCEDMGGTLKSVAGLRICEGVDY